MKEIMGGKEQKERETEYRRKKRKIKEKTKFEREGKTDIRKFNRREI